MSIRTIILAAVLAAIGSAAGAETTAPFLDCTRAAPEFNIPQICVWRGTPPAAQPAPAKPATVNLKPARDYADRGDANTLQQAQAHADQGDARTLAAAQQNTAAQVAVLQRETAAGIAQAAALVPLDPSADGETTINVGAATYAGQTALGLSLSHRSGRMTFSAGAGTSGGSRTLVRVGLGWRF